MSKDTLVFVAKDTSRNGLPVFLFLHRKALIDVYPKESLETVNDLLGCKNAEQLLSAAGKTGPMIPWYVREESESFAASDIMDVIDSRLEPLDFDSFQQIMFFENPNVGFGSKAPSQRVVRDFDPTTAENKAKIREWAENHSKEMKNAFIEPIEDYMLVRNFMSLASRLAGLFPSCDEDSPILELAGFHKVSDKTTRKEYFVLPLTFGSGEYDGEHEEYRFRESSLLEEITKEKEGDFYRNVFQPLWFANLPERAPRHPFKGLGSRIDRAFIELGRGGRLRLDSKERFSPYGDLVFACVEDVRNSDQMSAAITMFDSLVESFHDLRIGAMDLGLRFARGRLSPSTNHEDPLCHSEAAALFVLVEYRKGCVARVCKHCGNGILDVPKGRQKEFCSNSCRAAFYAAPRASKSKSDG